MPFKSRVFVVVLLLVALGCTQGGAASRLARSLEHEFSQHHLSSGAPKTAVVAFMRAHGIQYTEIPRRRIVVGWILNVDKGFLGKADVRLAFYFDGDDKLTKHEISPEYTGL